MTFDLSQILASKRAYRRTLAATDIRDKLKMLDALRARALALREHAHDGQAVELMREDASPYRMDGEAGHRRG